VSVRRWAAPLPWPSEGLVGQLAARYPGIVKVVLGTTFGVMLADMPAVFRGDEI
jgi:hypothetical protein